MRLTVLGLNFALVLFSILVALVGAEAAVRWLGYQPWQVKDLKIKVEPGGKFFIHTQPSAIPIYRENSRSPCRMVIPLK